MCTSRCQGVLHEKDLRRWTSYVVAIYVVDAVIVNSPYASVIIYLIIFVDHQMPGEHPRVMKGLQLSVVQGYMSTFYR